MVGVNPSLIKIAYYQHSEILFILQRKSTKTYLKTKCYLSVIFKRKQTIPALQKFLVVALVCSLDILNFQRVV